MPRYHQTSDIPLRSDENRRPQTPLNEVVGRQDQPILVDKEARATGNASGRGIELESHHRLAYAGNTIIFCALPCGGGRRSGITLAIPTAAVTG
jgi:hypothetical protein